MENIDSFVPETQSLGLAVRLEGRQTNRVVSTWRSLIQRPVVVVAQPQTLLERALPLARERACASLLDSGGTWLSRAATHWFVLRRSRAGR